MTGLNMVEQRFSLDGIVREGNKRQIIPSRDFFHQLGSVAHFLPFLGNIIRL